MMCPKCGAAELKLVPAGIGKVSGKPYNAFWSCTDRNCGFTKKLEGAGTVPAQAMNNVAQKTEDKKWEEISTGKVRHGFAIEAFKASKPLSNETVKLINDWTKFVMTGKLELPLTFEEQAINMSAEEPEIRVENIPF